MRASRARLGVLLALGALPWTVVVIGTEYTGVFLWGLFNTNPPQPVTLYNYLFSFTGGYASLPLWLQSWPITTALWACATTSAAVGAVFDVEDPRITAGLLVLAAVTNVRLASGFLSRVDQTALPVGSVVVLVVVWWFYVPLVRERSERPS